MKVFVSYSHRQREWVLDRLVPCLTAGSAEVLIDRERFKAGKAVVGQMDATQDRADRHVLVLSTDYLQSTYCCHEMNRALRLDPRFERGVVVPVKLDDCTLPDTITGPNAPLYVDLRHDHAPDQWTLLLDQCGANLGVAAPAWLRARDDTVRFLGRGQSVSLVVGDAVQWRPLIEHVVRRHFPNMANVDLANPATISRHGLVSTILDGLGWRHPVPPRPDDLAEFGRVLDELGQSFVALRHFDLYHHRWADDLDLFAALRYLVMDTRRLVLLAQSRSPFGTFLPSHNPLSAINIQTVELK